MNGGRSRTSIGNHLITGILLMVVVILILALKSRLENPSEEIPIPVKAPSVADKAGQSQILWESRPRPSERLMQGDER